MAKGAVMAIALIVMVFLVVWGLKRLVPNWVVWLILDTVIVFYCLAGTTLIREVREVFWPLTARWTRGASRWPASWGATPHN